MRDMENKTHQHLRDEVPLWLMIENMDSSLRWNDEEKEMPTPV